MPKDEPNHKDDKKTDGDNGQQLNRGDNNDPQSNNGDGRGPINHPVVPDKEKLLKEFLQSGGAATGAKQKVTELKTEQRTPGIPSPLGLPDLSIVDDYGVQRNNPNNPFVDPGERPNPASLDLLKLHQERRAREQNQSAQPLTIYDLLHNH